MKIKVLASGSKGNSYLVQKGGASILLDAGLPLKQIQIGLGYSVSQLSGVLVSHAHLDHCQAVKDLARLGVDIFASAATFEALKLKGHRYHEIAAKAPFRLGCFQVLPFALPHDVPNLGYLLQSASEERLLYITDALYCPYKFDRITHLMIEANHDREQLKTNIQSGLVNDSLGRRIIKTHMSIETVLDMLKANDLSKLRQVYLIHLSDDNSLAERFKDSVQRATGAEVFIC